MPLSEKGLRCANLILARMEGDAEAALHDCRDIHANRENLAAGMADALRHLASTSSPAASFELGMIADEIDPAVPR